MVLMAEIWRTPATILGDIIGSLGALPFLAVTREHCLLANASWTLFSNKMKSIVVTMHDHRQQVPE